MLLLSQDSFWISSVYWSSTVFYSVLWYQWFMVSSFVCSGSWKEELDTSFSVLLLSSCCFLSWSHSSRIRCLPLPNSFPRYGLVYSYFLCFLLDRVNCLAWELFIFSDASLLNCIHFLLQWENKLAFEQEYFGSPSVKKINIAYTLQMPTKLLSEFILLLASLLGYCFPLFSYSL